MQAITSHGSLASEWMRVLVLEAAVGSAQPTGLAS